MGYDTRGNENYQVVGYGRKSWSVGFARRDAGNAVAPDGTVLNDHFTQYSATIEGNWERGPLRFEVQAIPALGLDDSRAFHAHFTGTSSELARIHGEELKPCHEGSFRGYPNCAQKNKGRKNENVDENIDQPQVIRRGISRNSAPDSRRHGGIVDR